MTAVGHQQFPLALLRLIGPQDGAQLAEAREVLGDALRRPQGEAGDHHGVGGFHLAGYK